MKNRKIIDLSCYGNWYELIFTLGDDADVFNCSGNNWDTAPFEESDFVCKKFIKGYFTVNINYNAIVIPTNDKRHCRNDVKNLLLPCLAIVPPQYANDYKSYDFKDLVKEAQKPNSPIIVIHFGDGIADVFKRLRESNTLIYTKSGWKSRRKYDDDDGDYYDNYSSEDDKNNKKITFNTIKEMLRGEDYYDYANIDGQDYDD